MNSISMEFASRL